MSAKRCLRLGVQVTLNGGALARRGERVPPAGPAAGVPVLRLLQESPASLGINFAEESTSRRTSLGEGAENRPGVPFPGSWGCLRAGFVPVCERLCFHLQQCVLGWHGAVDVALWVRWGQQGQQAAVTVWRHMGEGCRAAPTQPGRKAGGATIAPRLYIHTYCM